MEIIRGEIIVNQEVEIDDKMFIDCILTDCVLGYSGRPVVFRGTRLERCRYVFFGDAQNIVRFLHSVGLLIGGDACWRDYEKVAN